MGGNPTSVFVAHLRGPANGDAGRALSIENQLLVRVVEISGGVVELAITEAGKLTTVERLRAGQSVELAEGPLKVETVHNRRAQVRLTHRAGTLVRSIKLH